jgi:hypothetical protein
MQYCCHACASVHVHISRIGHLGFLLPGESDFGFYAAQKNRFAKTAPSHHLSHSQSDSLDHANTYSPNIAYILGSNMAVGGACRVLYGGCGFWLAAGYCVMKQRLGVYLTVFALAIFNGAFSPRSFLVFALQGIWYPAFIPAPLSQMFLLSGVISAVLHLLVTGVPAALFERFVSSNRDHSALVWLGVMAVPTYQTLRHLGWP